VAGRFYPEDAVVLASDIEQCMDRAAEKRGAIGALVPHAGYMYSGAVAGAVYSRLKLPPRLIILCPNHTGLGAMLSIMPAGTWRTPLGDVFIDTELAERLLQRNTDLEPDTLAHAREHAIEVQLPFVQQAAEQPFRFVPIVIGTGRFDTLATLGETLARTAAEFGSDILLLASSDMNHYESEAVTRVKDAKAIGEILRLDARGLYDTVRREGISMCGFGPAVAMLTAAEGLHAASAKLVQYSTSAETSGDFDRVVGYAGIIVS
jgi:AmmeMemoRadiSam system protein B